MSGETSTFINERHKRKIWRICLGYITVVNFNVTEADTERLLDVMVNYNVFWSDHFPLEIICKMGNLKPKSELYKNNVFDKDLWGMVRDTQQIIKYNDQYNSRIKYIKVPIE